MPGTKHKQILIQKREAEILEMFANGAIDKEVYKKIGVSVATFYEYLKNNPEFHAKIWEAKNKFDSEEVENSLKKRALGYEYEEVTTEITEGASGQRKTIKKVKKHVPADTTAIIFHLKNRNPAKWRDRQEQIVTVTDLTKIAEEFDKVIGAS